MARPTVKQLTRALTLATYRLSCDPCDYRKVCGRLQKKGAKCDDVFLLEAKADLLKDRLNRSSMEEIGAYCHENAYLRSPGTGKAAWVDRICEEWIDRQIRDFKKEA